MKFTHPCFVKIIDKEERKKYITYLKDLGYTHLPFFRDSEYVSTDCYGNIWLTDSNRCSATDCGSNISYAMAVAAINDENDYMQYFKITKATRGRTICCKSWHKGEIYINRSECLYIYLAERSIKSTPEELKEYFNK